MLIVVSPAKRLDWTVDTRLARTDPDFLPDASYLAGVARQIDTAGLERLMGLSTSLAKLNVARFQSFAECPDGPDTRPAALTFAGDTYRGLEAGKFNTDELDWAQDRLRILSGLYGLLRPLDRIQPYRLEMGTRLANRAGKSLYEYWGARLAEALNTQAERLGTDVLLNCASVEYFRAVDREALRPRVVTPVFREVKAGAERSVSVFAKLARGSLARFVVERRLTDPAGLRDFDLGGYRYCPDRSEGEAWVFLRDAEVSADAA